MDQARHDLLARPALAGDEHRRVALGDPHDDVVHPLHRSALAHHLVAGPQAVDGAAQALDLLAQLAVLDRPLDGEDQLLDGERLGHEVVGARPDRPDGRFDAREGRHDDDRRLFAQGDDLLAEIDTAHAPHVDVGQHDREVAVAKVLQGLAGRHLHGDLVRAALELGLQRVEQARVVVDDQDASVHRLPSLPPPELAGMPRGPFRGAPLRGREH